MDITIENAEIIAKSIILTINYKMAIVFDDDLYNIQNIRFIPENELKGKK